MARLSLSTSRRFYAWHRIASSLRKKKGTRELGTFGPLKTYLQQPRVPAQRGARFGKGRARFGKGRARVRPRDDALPPVAALVVAHRHHLPADNSNHA